MQTVLGVLFIATLMAGVGMLVLALYRVYLTPTDTQARLGKFVERATVQEQILAVPFYRRAFGPAAARLRERMVRGSREERIKALNIRLARGGRPYGLGAGDFLTAKAAVAGLAFVGGFLLLTLAGFQILIFIPFVSAVIGAMVIGALGYFFPDLALYQAVKDRTEAMRKQLPDVLDMMSMCADAGLSFDSALQRVVENHRFDGPLTEELNGVVRQIRMGIPRLDALEEMAERMQIDEVSSFVNAMRTQIEMGVGIKDALRAQAADVRRRFKLQAQTKANQAAIKMLFPMVGLIFPCLLLVLMYPGLSKLFTP